MKHIKSFKLYEGVIKPYDFDPAIEELKSLPEITKEELERVLAPMNVEFVDVEYFKSKLQTKKEIELVPENMAPMLGGVRFAAHNVHTDKMYVCVLWDQFLRSINDNNGKDLVNFLISINDFIDFLIKKFDPIDARFVDY